MDYGVLVSVIGGFGLHFFVGFVNAILSGKEKFDSGKALSTAAWGVVTILVLANSGEEFVKQLSNVNLNVGVGAVGLELNGGTLTGVAASALTSKLSPVLSFVWDIVSKAIFRKG